MVFANKYTQALISKFVNFANSQILKEEIELMGNPESITPYTIFSGLTNYVIDELIKKNENITQEEIDIYNFIEEIRIKYSEFPENTDEYDFDNAACTCFLENLLNRASAGRILYNRFIPYLGEKSKEFCRAWDEFTGVKSPGLWEN